jgi:hypothetical protein
MPLTDFKKAVADKADADDRATRRSQAMTEALRGDLSTKRTPARERQEAAGIPTSTPINGVDPEVQAERDARKAARDTEAPSMSDIIRGNFRRENVR